MKALLFIIAFLMCLCFAANILIVANLMSSNDAKDCIIEHKTERIHYLDSCIDNHHCHARR